MDTNPGTTPNGQPQGDDFSVPPASPPQSPLPAVPQTLPPQYQPSKQAPSPFAIKPAWQVQAMQNVRSQQGGSSPAPTAIAPYNTSSRPNEPYLQQPYQFTGQQTAPAQSLHAPTGPPQQPPNSTANYNIPSKSSKGWLIAIVLLVLLGIAGIAAIFMLMRGGGNNEQAQQALTAALANSFKTQTYNEALVMRKGAESTARNRVADFRKLDEPRLYVDSIAPLSEKDATAVTVIGNSYYVKKHFSEEALSKASPEKAALQRLGNDQWTSVIQKGTELNDPVTTALDVLPALRTMRVVVPSPLPIGYFREDQQKQLSDFVQQNQVYIPGEVTTENVNNTDTWHFHVMVNTGKVRELNTKIAAMQSAKQPESVTDQFKDIPNQMEIWVRKSDNRIVQYSYQQGDTSYAYRYDKIDQQVEVATPKLASTPPSGESASDSDIQAASDTLFNSLAEYQSQGNALPNNTSSFDEFVSQKLEAPLRERFNISYKGGIPGKGYIFYQSGSVCKSDNSGLQAIDSDDAFAVLTKLSGSLYCVDNTD